MRHLTIRFTHIVSMLALILAAARTVTAQPTSPNPPPAREPWDGAVEVRFPLRETCPSLSTDMPLDVLVGYIAADSLARMMPPALVDTLRRTLTYSDTLRQALRYFYTLVDWDPVRFFQWTGKTQSGVRIKYPTPTLMLQDMLIYRARVACPDSQRTAALCAADIIAHVRVNSVRTKIDTNAAAAKHSMLVSSTIIDPIKGGQIPNCSIDARTKVPERSVAGTFPPARAEGTQPAVSGACFQFEVRSDWSRQGGKYKPTYPGIEYLSDSTLRDGFAGNPGPWLQPDTEYFIFLQFRGLGLDSIESDQHFVRYHYATLLPLAWFGFTCGLYPVIDGKVYDPHDDFGFGMGLTPTQFAAALRAKISSIIHP